jgi:uncharacterized integral membrane protein
MSVRGDEPEDFPIDPAAAAQERRQADLDHLKRLRKARQQRLVRAGLVAAILVVLIIFVLQNARPVPVQLLFMSGRPLLIWVIVFSAALGGVVGYLLARPSKATRLHEEGGGKGRNRKR